MNERFAAFSRSTIDGLSRVFAEIPELEAAYLFGSAVNQEAGSAGDVDLAVLCRRVPDVEFVHAVLRAAQDALGRDDVDLILLNSASPILRFEAINGERLVRNSPSRVAAFESLVAREYEDEMARLGRRPVTPRGSKGPPCPPRPPRSALP